MRSSKFFDAFVTPCFITEEMPRKSDEDMADPKQIIRSDTIVSSSQNKVSKLIQKSTSQVNQDVTIDQIIEEAERLYKFVMDVK